jgi:hypothetical protein
MRGRLNTGDACCALMPRVVVTQRDDIEARPVSPDRIEVVGLVTVGPA